MALLGTKVITEATGTWLLWADNPARPFEFHVLRLTNEHGDMLEVEEDLVEHA